jgi:hypothetical protein
MPIELAIPVLGRKNVWLIDNYPRPDVPPRRPRTCSTARYMSAADDCGRPKSCKMCGMALRVSNSRCEALCTLAAPGCDDECVTSLGGRPLLVFEAFTGSDAADRGGGVIGERKLSMLDKDGT